MAALECGFRNMPSTDLWINRRPVRSPSQNNTNKIMHMYNSSLFLMTYPPKNVNNSSNTSITTISAVSAFYHSCILGCKLYSHCFSHEDKAHSSLHFFFFFPPWGCVDLSNGLFLIRWCFLTHLCLCTCCSPGLMPSGHLHLANFQFIVHNFYIGFLYSKKLFLENNF